MWLTFVLAIIAACVILFVPGYCLFRALRFSSLVSLCLAPAGSVFFVSALATALASASFPTNAVTVSALLVALCAMLLAVGRVLDARAGGAIDCLRAEPLDSKRRAIAFEPVALACYVAFGVLVCAFVFIPCLTGSPDALFARWDNQTHLNMVRSFMDSESWSALKTGYYLGVEHSANPYANPSSGGFYPAAWHIVCAYICSAVGASVPLGANALNAVVSAVVYPAGMFLLLKAIFPKNRLAIAAGVVITMAFTAFPWALFVKGPLYPNLIANAVLPSVLGMVVLVLEQGLLPKKWLVFTLASIVGFLSLVVTQVNTVFAVYVFLAAYGAHFIWNRLRKSGASQGKSFAIVGIYLVGIVVFWTICYKLPFMQGVVQYTWAATVSVPFAIAMAGSFAMPSFMPEYLLAPVAAIGLLSCLRKRRFWIIFPALIMMIGFILDRSTEGFLKHFISGFWYTDPFRTAAMYAIFVTPVACLGFAAIVSWLRSKNFHLLAPFKSTPALFCALMLVFCVVTYFPSFSLPIGDGIKVNTAYGSLHARFLDSYRTDKEQVLSADERAFVDRALEKIPAGALVINQPNDGSVFTYGANDLNVFYRSCRAGGQTDEGKAIRLSLDKYADNDKVRAAVESTGAEYLLLLDQGVPYEEGKWLPQYDAPESWKGIDAVRDDTPGFTLLLSDGDMRLYKIG